MSTAKQINRFRKAYEKAVACKWKGGPASLTSHLKRRKKRGHLSENATEVQMVQKGLEALKFLDSAVYEYIPTSTVYFVVHKDWAIFFVENGLWDTTFPPDVPERYFDLTKGYTLLGKLSELIS